MTSITKHQYDYTNGKCANKENESSNGKRNDVTKSSSGIDSNFDWAKKEAINQQRKLRLVQVRQQSKEIASQIRENVRDEEKRQVDKITRIKQDELFNWRQKQIAATEKDYEHCLNQIGEAHTAAERENAKQRQIDEQREKNRRMALKRGKIAAEKLKTDPKMKQTKPIKPVKGKVIDHSKKVDNSPESSSSDTSSSSTLSSDSSVSSVILVENRKKPETKVKMVPVSPKSSISHKPSSSTNVKESKSPTKIVEYNPMRYASANNSSVTDVSLTDSPTADPPPFITKVSDFLGHKPTKPALRSSPYIAKTYKLDKSPVSNRTNTKRSTAKSQINTVSSRLSRTIQTPTKTSGKSPMKVLPDRKHFVPEFVKTKPSVKTKKDSAIQTTPQRISKVQFYDHANKHSKQYDGSIDLEERVLNILPLNAWEEAKREKEADEYINTERLHLKMLAENRSRVALEKEKIRKDYELMSSQLSEILKNNELANSFVQSNELLSESRLRQIAEEKQQLMNKDFRDVLKGPLITCPKVKKTIAKPASTQHRPKSGDLNVAQNKSNASKSKPRQSQDNDISSESTHSFLLDCFAERTNTICDDIKRCRQDNNEKNQTKIEALHELLSQVNSFRRILCEEIQQNNGDTSRIDASQFLTEIEKMEEKQHAIMKEKATEKTLNKKQTDKKPASQKREQELKERERQLKIKESCIDERARELYLREKKIEEQKNQSKKVILKQSKDKNVSNEKGATKSMAIVTTNGGECLDEIPVRIVINVNKNEQKNEKYTDVVVNDVKWREKLAKSKQLKENIQSVPVANGSGKLYPKTPGKTKVVTVEKQQVDISSQSSTSITAYLSPPDQIKTNLTNALQQSAICNESNVQQDESLTTNDAKLLQYIIRMLGMSRTSIEQLNMSSVSTVKTPNSSVINISSNRQYTSSASSTPISQSSLPSIEQIQSIDKAKLQQLARYLAENNKLATSARKDSKESGASSGIWDDILSKKTEPTSKSERTTIERPKPVESADLAIEEMKDSDEKLSRGDLIAKYDELAANCTKRIINLDSMISKVREEKQKLLENTLSSASSLITGQKENATEYMEYPQPEQNQQMQAINSTGSPLSDSKGTNAPSSDFSSTSGTAETSMPIDNRAGLFSAKCKPLGESKDSGVGISRPVTSSDYRESPDLKQNTKATDPENGSKLLQSALRENKRDLGFEPFLKGIAKSNHQMPLENEDQAEPIATNNRDKTKQAPPVAMARYSPQMEDEIPHELSTITEVDTPATSRLNATDMTNGNDSTLKNNTVKLAPDSDALKLLYNAFPNFKDYIKSNPDMSQATVDETIDITAGVHTIPDDKLSKMLEPQGSKANELKYKPFDGDDQRPHIDSKLHESNLHLSYSKFPTHAEYAKSVSGLLDSQSIEQMHNSDDHSNSSSNSTLPDIVNELKNRKILEHSFEEATGNVGDFDDLLLVHGNANNTTQSRKEDETFSDALENELNSMGLSWVTAELKKSKPKISPSTSTSSDTLDHTDKSRRPPNNPSPPKRIAKRTFQKMNQSRVTNDSFVDKNLIMSKMATEEGTATTQPTDCDIGQSINLKDFLARELLKHSSMSSSSDSSLASIFLKSFLGQSNRASPDTPQSRGLDKHRTSTPVDHSKGESASTDGKGDSNSRKCIRASSFTNDMFRNEAGSHIFFPNDSQQLSSVRLSTTDSTSTSTFSDERHK